MPPPRRRKKHKEVTSAEEVSVIGVLVHVAYSDPHSAGEFGCESIRLCGSETSESHCSVQSQEEHVPRQWDKLWKRRTRYSADT